MSLKKTESLNKELSVGVCASLCVAHLPSVTNKVFALISPHSLSGHYKHHHTEHENHGQPDPPEGCGVFVHSTHQALQS